MALIENIDQVYAHVGFDLSFEFSEIRPYILNVELGELTRYVGKDLYERILAENNPTEIEDLCREKMIQYVARMAAVKWIPMGQVRFGRDGITTVGKSESRTAAYDQQIQQVSASLLELAASSLEHLLSCLETPEWLTELPEYADSTERQKYNSLLFKNAIDFSEVYPIHNSSLTFFALRPTMARIETQNVAELLGDIYDSLKGGSLSTLENKLLITTRYYIAFQTVADVIELEQSLELSANGLKIYYGSQYANAKYFTPPSEAQRLVTMQAAQRRAEGYWSNMSRLYLEIKGVTVEDSTSVGIISSDKIVGF